jgi:ribosomal protein S3
MGQKVHPLGFRVGITKQQQSTWFARFYKHQYAQTVLEDQMIRTKLTKLFPELLNPVLKKTAKSDESSKRMPKITEIKIERGLIPYEIGIQIHAGNCEVLKSAMDNLTVSENIRQTVEKNKRYLLDLRLKLGDLVKLQKTMKEKTSEVSSEEKQTQKNLKLAQKRWRKRQNLRERSLERSLDNVLIVKKGKTLERTVKQTDGKGRKPNKFRKTRALSSQKFLSTNVSQKNKKKFVDIFTNKMNQKFLGHLKDQLRYWNEKISQHKQTSAAPVGYSKKWNLNRLKSLRNQPLIRLIKLGKDLQNRALTKMEKFKKDYFEFGMLTKVQTLSYYQLIQFIKGLKRLILVLKQEQRAQQLLNSPSSISRTRISKTAVERIEKSVRSLTERSLRKKLDNINDECRKIQFIEFLTETVKKHRTENLYLYLGTIANSRKALKQISQFTRNYSNFLFGIDLNSVKVADKDQVRPQLESRIAKILKNANRKSEFEKGLSDIFLEQIEKQRQMHKATINLTPKISLKFYSVKAAILEAKANVIADAIVDDLEKRKAFRSVIKQAKEKLMTSNGVKGVKIQVAGRLNGAEIARTEWVRSGRVPLQTLRANIDYSYKTANTIYGIIGVKVWIYKGSAKFRKATSLSA